MFDTSLDEAQCTDLLATLRARFDANMDRHAGLDWAGVREKLNLRPEKWFPLFEMEASGGEPDVVDFDVDSQEYIFFDCAEQTPAGRRNLCYDRAALNSRKANKPRGNAVDTAAAMGVELLTEAQYRALQQLFPFDTKTSSWVATPEDIRKLGGALFCDRRYGHVFTYHNGAESYYTVRGFRGVLRV